MRIGYMITFFRSGWLRVIEGSVLVANGGVDTSVLSIQELDVIDKVCHVLGNMSSREFTQLSHQELGWKENREKHNRIAFDYAFGLKAL